MKEECAYEIRMLSRPIRFASLNDASCGPDFRRRIKPDLGPITNHVVER
jgi:hypothetical protein